MISSQDPFYKFNVVHLDFNVSGGTTVPNAHGEPWALANNAVIDNSVFRSGIGSLKNNSMGNPAMCYPTGPKSVFDFGTGDFTIEMWLRSYNINGYQNAFAMKNGIDFYQSFGYNPTASLIAMEGGNYTGTANTWFHVAASRKSGVVRVFVNGSKTNEVTNTVNMYSTSIVNLLANGHGGGGESWSGWIDSFRVTRAARYVNDFSPNDAFGGGPGGGVVRNSGTFGLSA